MDSSYLQEWAGLLLRWLHLIAGVAWIGTSFYFVGLDLSLEPPRGGNPRVRGEQWSIHGGGFYHKQKYLLAPERLPETLHWFKWEAYWTWLSGFALFVLIYWGQAGTYLVDPAVLDIAPGVAILLSAAMLIAGWVAYDLLCRSRLGEREGALAWAGTALLAGAAILACHLFSGRGAFIQIGAMIGTIMAANVAMVIIPGQRRMVAAMTQGEEPDAKYGRWGKQRSVHNNYLTLPVLFLMISPHHPMTWQHPLNWAVLLAVALAGALVRHFYNLRHTGRTVVPLPIAGAAVVAALAILIAPERAPRGVGGAAVPSLAEVEAIAAARCIACHAGRPTMEGVAAPPKGVLLDTPAQLRRWAPTAAQQVVLEAMPPGNLTGMTEEERRALRAWAAAGAPTGR